MQISALNLTLSPSHLLDASWVNEEAVNGVLALSNLNSKIQELKLQSAAYDRKGGSGDGLSKELKISGELKKTEELSHQLFTKLTGPVDVDFHKGLTERFSILKVFFQLSVPDSRTRILIKKVDIIKSKVFIFFELLRNSRLPQNFQESDHLVDVEALVNMKISEKYNLENLSKNIYYFGVRHKKIELKKDPCRTHLFFVKNMGVYSHFLCLQAQKTAYIDSIIQKRQAHSDAGFDTSPGKVPQSNCITKKEPCKPPHRPAEKERATPIKREGADESFWSFLVQAGNCDLL